MKYSAKKLDVSGGIVREQEWRNTRHWNSVTPAIRGRDSVDALQTPAHPAIQRTSEPPVLDSGTRY